MLDVGFLILLAAWSAGVGLWLCARLGGRPEHPADALALAIPLGLGALALAVLGLAEIGWLTAWGLAAVVTAGALLGATKISVETRSLFATYDSSQPSAQKTLVEFVFDACLALTLTGSLLTALAPVTDGDALCYHLQVPKVFLENHAATFDPDLHETVYPLVTEMLFAVALACRGPLACRLVSWLLGIVLALNVNALARPILGRRARWAGTIALLVPAISNGMGAPLNDVALAAFANVALHALILWREAPSPRRALLTGLLAGFALGVKYPALVWVGLLGISMAAVSLGSRRNSPTRPPVSHVAAFAVTAILCGGCWYLRAYHHTGNPVYPFFRQFFGGAGIDEVLSAVKRPLPVTVLNMLTALVPITLWPDRFDSFSHQFGPAFLLFLPGLFLWRAPRRVWSMALLGFAFLTLCLTQRQSMRFVLTAIGPMSVAVGWLVAVAWDQKRVPGRILATMLLVILAFEASLAVARCRHGLPVVFGRETPEQFLTRREPTYRVGQWAAGQLPVSARIVGQDHRGFYIPRPYTMELAHRRRTKLGTRHESAARIVQQLRSEGFTHLLMCPPALDGAVEFDPTLNQRLAPWLASRRAVYDESLADADGVVRRYQIYDLRAVPDLAGTGSVRR